MCVKHTQNTVPLHEQISAWNFVYVKLRGHFLKVNPFNCNAAFGSSRGVCMGMSGFAHRGIAKEERLEERWLIDKKKMKPTQSPGLRKMLCGQNSGPEAFPGRPLCSSPAHRLGSLPQSLKSGCFPFPTDPQK